MKKITLVLLLLPIICFSQKSSLKERLVSQTRSGEPKINIQKEDRNKSSKLVVGIVVDQMRFDYIYRFWNEFNENGFKRLVNNGHFFRNCQFGYVPTYTGLRTC